MSYYNRNIRARLAAEKEIVSLAYRVELVGSYWFMKMKLKNLLK